MTLDTRIYVYDEIDPHSVLPPTSKRPLARSRVCIPMMWAFREDEKMYRDIREIWRKFDER